MDKCAQCGLPLSRCKEIHAVEGRLYCSKKCAINNQIEVIQQSAEGTAEEWYNDCAETVSPASIGIPCNDYTVVITETIIMHTNVSAQDPISAVEDARKQFEQCVYDEVVNRETTYDAIKINIEQTED